MVFPFLKKCFQAAIIFLIAVIVLSIIIIVLFAIFDEHSDPIINSLPSYQNKVMYTAGEFQDYTDYGIYDYNNIDLSELENNDYLKSVDFHANDIIPYIEDFEKRVDTHRITDPNHELPANYDFDKTIIDENDYYYIIINDGEPVSIDRKFFNYDVYIFDTQTKKLYFFHNNI